MERKYKVLLKLENLVASYLEVAKKDNTIAGVMKQRAIGALAAMCEIGCIDTKEYVRRMLLIELGQTKEPEEKENGE
jgi:hypothetical protein